MQHAGPAAAVPLNIDQLHGASAGVPLQTLLAPMAEAVNRGPGAMVGPGLGHAMPAPGQGESMHTS